MSNCINRILLFFLNFSMALKSLSLGKMNVFPTLLSQMRNLDDCFYAWGSYRNVHWRHWTLLWRAPGKVECHNPGTFSFILRIGYYTWLLYFGSGLCTCFDNGLTSTGVLLACVSDFPKLCVFAFSHLLKHFLVSCEATSASEKL